MKRSYPETDSLYTAISASMRMKRYKNLAGGSGILAYGTGKDSIKVQFAGGRVYTYTHESAGRRNIEHMKNLASAGRGLSSFISGVVKERFASKSR